MYGRKGPWEDDGITMSCLDSPWKPDLGDEGLKRRQTQRHTNRRKSWCQVGCAQSDGGHQLCSLEITNSL